MGELMQCVYKSLAECYADAIRNLSEVTGKPYTSVNIVGDLADARAAISLH